MKSSFPSQINPSPEAGLRKVLPMAGGFKVLLHLILVLLADFIAGKDTTIGRETLPEQREEQGGSKEIKGEYGYR